MDQKSIRSWLSGISFLLLSLLLFLSLVSFSYDDISFYSSSRNPSIRNYIGIVGAYTAAALFFLFGSGVYIIAAALFFLGLEELSFIDFRGLAATVWRRVFAFFALVVSFSILYSLPWVGSQTEMFSRGGLLGYSAGSFLIRYLNSTGTYIVIGLIFFISSVLFCGYFVYSWTVRLAEALKKVWQYAQTVIEKMHRNGREMKPEKLFEAKPATLARTPPKIEMYTPPPSPKEETAAAMKRTAVEPREAQMPVSTKPAAVQTDPVKKEADSSPLGKPAARTAHGPFRLPSENLLSLPESVDHVRLREDIERNAKILEETLFGFGVQAKVVNVQKGPVVTRYEMEPAPGVKINRIVALADDITLAMKTSSVRIVAPIPGRGAVGVEIPNQHRILVCVREIIADRVFKNSPSLLTLAIGKDTAGAPYVSDLNEMPHLLIAGATGSGKTVCVNSLICSMIFKASPDRVKFLMVDPKTVELAPYRDIPHLIHPIISDAKKASHALFWLVEEMERRYKLLNADGARNIEAYNAKEFRLPYIVIIIDELADLMAVARDSIESSIQRLAQLSRAVGLHLILATQRPSVDVITGVIKANLPARIAFKVASRVDSNTIIDSVGAERLIGKGDMLFMKAGLVKPMRLQGCFVSDEDIARLIAFIKTQAEPEYTVQLAESVNASRLQSKDDDLFDESVRIVLESRQASASILQRRLRIGYNRAARLIDLMEVEGIVGPFQGSKARQILTTWEEWSRIHKENTDAA